VLGLLAACSGSAPDIEDGGFLSGEPCGPPCFWGIVPGETTEAEVKEVLQKRGVYNACETQISKFEEGGRGIDCKSQIFIGFEQGSDLVQAVYFKPSSRITVQEVVAQYGEPDGILMFSEGVPEHPRLSLSILYSDILSRLELPIQEWPGYDVEPSTPVLSIVYDPKFSYVQGNYQFEKWTGYGEY
jgi:hypothetical protein